MLNGERQRVGGFTYILLLVIVAVIAAASSAALSIGSKMERAQAELDLSWTEQAYARAIESYRAASPGARRGPPKIADLLRDPRYPGTVRHLRRAYVDPLTLAGDWRVFRVADGGISAICRPLATSEPPSDGVLREPDDPCAPYSALASGVIVPTLAASGPLK